jgi:hypothetical protein
LKRGQIFQISKIDASILPPLFSLVDLMKDPVPGHFYREQLTVAPNPNLKTDFFEVEKILKTSIFQKKKYFLGKLILLRSDRGSLIHCYVNESMPFENDL